jgi:hypothetical protein
MQYRFLGCFRHCSLRGISHQLGLRFRASKGRSYTGQNIAAASLSEGPGPIAIQKETPTLMR